MIQLYGIDLLTLKAPNYMHFSEKIRFSSTHILLGITLLLHIFGSSVRAHFKDNWIRKSIKTKINHYLINRIKINKCP